MKAITTDSMLGGAFDRAFRSVCEQGVMSSAHQAFGLHPNADDANAPPAVLVYVKVIRFSKERLLADPDSGGLMADL